MNLIGGFTFLNQITDFTTSPELSGATAVTTKVINGETYVFVAGYWDDGIQVLKVENDVLVPVFDITDTASLGLSRVTDLKVVDVGGNSYLIAIGQNDDAINSFRITTDATGTDGHLTHVQTIFDNAPGGTTTTLDYAISLKTVVTSGGTYAVVAAYNDDALTVFRVNADGTMTQTAAVTDGDNAAYFLDGVGDVAVHTVGGRHFVYATSAQNDGISVFELNTNGTLTSRQHFGAANFNVQVAVGVKVGDKDFLVVGDDNGYRLVTYEIAANGSLTEVATFGTYTNPGSNPAATYNLRYLEYIYVDGVPFIIASSPQPDKINIYGIDASGQINSVDWIAAPNAADGMTTFVQDGRIYLLNAGQGLNGVRLYEIGANEDTLIGGADNDSLVGLGGDDHLLGHDGDDVMYGGTGDDVLSGGRGNDVMYGGDGFDVLIGGGGNDVLNGGVGADILIGGGGRDTADYAGSSARVIINLETGSVSGGDATGDVLSSIENLTGSAFNDILTGDSGGNRLFGEDGNDVIYGGDGSDFLSGGNKNDRLYGGEGDDQVLGGSGRDNIDAGNGNDLVRGGGGHDTIAGAGGDDTLSGDAGNDRIDGGAGNDTLTGGAGTDIFIFSGTFGNDRITDFNLSQDRIDLSGVQQLNSFADVQANAFTFGGVTVINVGAVSSSIQLDGITLASLTADNFLF